MNNECECYEVKGFYGTNNPCTILVFVNGDGSRWYCVEDSKNINCTFDEIVEGTNVESLHDDETMQADEEIGTLDDLIRQIYQ